MAYCPACGAKLRENAIFCSKCGKSVDSPNLPNKSDPSLKTSKEKQSGIGLQLVLLAVVGLCLFAFVVWVWPVFLKSNQGDSMKGLLNPSSTNAGTKGSLPSQKSCR